MIFGNLRTIITDHYSSLGEETGLSKPYRYYFLAFLFGIVPLMVGGGLGWYIPIWTGLITASTSAVSVLTGFSINTLILLMRYNKNDSHPYEQKTVRKTKEFTLYSILLGVGLLISLVFGYLLTHVSISTGTYLMKTISILVYTIIAHYFLTLLVITHRLWSLVHGDVL